MPSWFSRHLKRPSAFDGPKVDTPAFELRLSKAWKQEPSRDPEQFSFVAGDGSLTTASWLSWNVDADRLPEAGKVLLETRARAMGQRLGDYPYAITDLEMVPVPTPGLEIYAYGAAEEISYYSRHYALLTERFVINLYVESPASSAKKNAAQFETVLAGLRIKTSMEVTVNGAQELLRPTRA